MAPPARIAHADWGTAPAKRVVATADPRDGVYFAHAPRTVRLTGGLLDRMYVGTQPSRQALLRFDFPIGVPRAYAEKAGISSFADWFARLDPRAPFFKVAEHVSDVSVERPFFPPNITTKSPGIKAEFRDRLGLSA